MMTKKRPPSSSSYEITDADLDARRTQRLKTAALLKSGRTALHVIKIAEEAMQTAEQAVASAMQREPPHPPSACAAGCAWCCYQRIGAAVPEIIHIAEFIRREFQPEEIAALEERIHKSLEQRRVQRGHIGIPCPLLVNNLCSVYPVRPLTCRGFNSSDPLTCERQARQKNRIDVPMYPPQLRLNTVVLDGMRAGTKEAGLFSDTLDLAAALAIALREPNAVDQWLQGKPAFAPARLT
jgi:Fe-S-cluster containining protein